MCQAAVVRLKMKQLEKKIYPVYIMSRVVYSIFDQCKNAVPSETLGRLMGYRLQWQGHYYTKIVDWTSGSLESSSTFAKFTVNGTRESEFFLDERYLDTRSRPKEIGLFHSHPFGTNPEFSLTDYETFLSFPYDNEGNIFILIDPISKYFKVYKLTVTLQKEQKLIQVPWISYFPKVS